MIRNPFGVIGSPLGGKLGCGKDVFYDFLNDARTDWRKPMYHISSQLWTKIRVCSDHKAVDTCLMIDDTDFPKTGKRIENIGRVYSHLEHKCILGFKALFLGLTDGVSQMLLDFALIGEKGKKGNFGMSTKELSRRYTTERTPGTPLEDRACEYTMNKIDLAIEMIRRAVFHKVWFLLCKRGEKRYSRKLGCCYMSADVVFAGIPVRLFFIRRSKRGPWGGLLCTDMKLRFSEAYRICSRRWSLEVIFKEGKGLLGLGKCQPNNFSAQIASTSLVALQYNVLSVVKRFTAYETIGGLFRAANQDSLEITVSERIWGVILELVAATTRVFNITDEEVLEAVVNESDELAHICELYRYKMAS